VPLCVLLVSPRNETRGGDLPYRADSRACLPHWEFKLPASLTAPCNYFYLPYTDRRTSDAEQHDVTQKEKEKKGTHVVLPLPSGQKGYGSVAITDDVTRKKKHLTAPQKRASTSRQASEQNQGNPCPNHLDLIVPTW